MAMAMCVFLSSSRHEEMDGSWKDHSSVKCGSGRIALLEDGVLAL